MSVPKSCTVQSAAFAALVKSAALAPPLPPMSSTETKPIPIATTATTASTIPPIIHGERPPPLEPEPPVLLAPEPPGGGLAGPFPLPLPAPTV